MKRSIQLTDVRNNPVLLEADDVSAVSMTSHMPGKYLNCEGSMLAETVDLLTAMKRLPTLVQLAHGEDFCVVDTFESVVQKLAEAQKRPE